MKNYVISISITAEEDEEVFADYTIDVEATDKLDHHHILSMAIQGAEEVLQKNENVIDTLVCH